MTSVSYYSARIKLWEKKQIVYQSGSKDDNFVNLDEQSPAIVDVNLLLNTQSNYKKGTLVWANLSGWFPGKIKLLPILLMYRKIIFLIVAIVILPGDIGEPNMSNEIIVCWLDHYQISTVNNNSLTKVLIEKLNSQSLLST